MPGKVNPSVPEMVNQVCYQVIGCDAAILAAADAGQLELNVMMPVIAWNAIHATHDPRAMPCACCRTRCVDGIAADEERCRELLDRSTALATALSPYIGYAADGGHRQDVRQDRALDSRIVRERRLLPEAQLDGFCRRSDDVARHARTRTRRRDSETMRDRCLAWCSRRGSRRRRPPSTRGCFRRRISGSSKGPDRDAWQRPDQIMDALRIGEGSVVADLGAGGGWFTDPAGAARRAERARLRRGHPAADDRAPSSGRVQREGLQNVDHRRSERPIDPRLPGGGLDAVLIVDAYHEMEQPVALLRNLAALAQAGRRASASSTSRRKVAGPDRRWTSASIRSG